LADLKKQNSLCRNLGNNTLIPKGFLLNLAFNLTLKSKGVQRYMITKQISKVEDYFLKLSGEKLIYPPTEKIPVITLSNFQQLGKIAALRFIEWVQNNPNGVISLPTGKIAQHFIKNVVYYLDNLESDNVKSELKPIGIDTEIKPDMKNLYFVQMVEFYPIDPDQQNSFNSYIRKYYFKLFSLDPKKALLIDIHDFGLPENLSIEEVFPDMIVDLSLRVRFPKNSLERLQKEILIKADQACTDYEKKIRDLGGIGFFLSGIGPDGHIGLNIRGSDHFSTTRLTQTNYETQAASATDLGGIEVARKRLVITVGLNTLTFNENASAIILAAGESSAKIVANSIQEVESNLYPSTALHKLPNARFYITKGTSIKLIERQYEKLTKSEYITQENIEKIILDLSVEKRKGILELNEEDYRADRFATFILSKTGKNIIEINKIVYDSIHSKIQKGMVDPDNQIFLHTAPHHDDIMLGYLPYVIHLVRSPLNEHYFTYMTSGFNAVTNSYVLELLNNLNKVIVSRSFRNLMEENYFDPQSDVGRSEDVSLYLDGVASGSRTKKSIAESQRLLRILIQLYEDNSLAYLKDKVDELISYFITQYPGKKDIPHIQRLKGMIREWEAELLWGYFGFNVSRLNHLRLGFYQGNLFSEEPDINRDIKPIYNLIKRVKPTIITVALDPEGSGPDTHYKVLQSVARALELYKEEDDISALKIWGYRNVWHRFHPANANIYVPVSLNSMAIMENAFTECFGSQRDASFPSPEYDGPFCYLARNIQVDQYLKIKNCLGDDFFTQNKHPRLRATHGLVFLKELTPKQFSDYALGLKESMGQK
jgi:glucosamine-6-phosphate deaminase